jgi:hypothetical protein
MKFAVCGYLIGAVSLLAAGFPAMPQAASGGSLAILGGTVWYLLARAFPAHCRAQREDRAAYLEAQAAERKAYLDAQSMTRREFRRSLRQMAKSVDGLTRAIVER